MAEVVLYLTGDQIGTYSDLSMSGNSNGVKLTLTGVEPLGTSDQVFRVVVRQVSDGQDAFASGQIVDIYAWPEADPPEGPIYSSLDPQHDQFQGRASSSEHQIFTEPAKIVFDLDGVTSGTMRYGPGLHPLRSEQLPFRAIPQTPPEQMCFAAGTLVEAEGGPVAVDALRAGHFVRTIDGRMVPLRWIARRRVRGIGPLAPIRFEPGAIGNWRALRLSPQHRVLVTGWRAEMWFGEPEILVPAKALVDGRQVRQVEAPSVNYLHLAFDAHEIVLAEGAPCESLDLAALRAGGLTRAQRAEIAAVFPDLLGGAPVLAPARPCLKVREGRILAA